MSEMNDADKKAMRIAIARDVIERVKSGELNKKNIIQGSYLENTEDMDKYSIDKIEESIKATGKYDAMIKTLSTTCYVCALGSMFLSAWRFKPQVDFLGSDGIDDIFDGMGLLDRDQVAKPLLDYFTNEQLCLIDETFEQGYGGYPIPNRLIQIMQAIIDNDGELEPIDDDELRKN